jgi:hypothetical protein
VIFHLLIYHHGGGDAQPRRFRAVGGANDLCNQLRYADLNFNLGILVKMAASVLRNMLKSINQIYCGYAPA